MPAIDARLKSPAFCGALPPLNALRPCRCHRCRGVAGAGLRLQFQGHGVRMLSVVLPPEPGSERAQLIDLPVRRFKCVDCGAVVAIYPPGVVPRCLFTLFAIVTAWCLSLRTPLGGGLTEEAVCGRQGVDRFPVGGETNRSGRRRWRSLSRWTARIGEWWPGRIVTGSTWRERISSLLTGFLAESDTEGMGGIVARAVEAHASSGAAM